MNSISERNSIEYKQRAAERRRERYKRVPEVYADQQYKRLYGISLSDYDRMYIDQKGLCAICSVSKPLRGKGRLHVDHCHETKKVRALLCTQCNVGIGMLKTDPNILEIAKNYLLKHKTE